MIQRVTGLLLALLAFATLGYNLNLYLQTESMGRLYWAVLSFIGLSVFAVTAARESRLYKIIQVSFIMLVSTAVIRYNSEPLIGAFFMLGNFALAFSYGFYDRLKWLGGSVTAALIFIPLLLTYQDFKRALLTTVAVFIVLFVTWLIARDKIKKEEKRLEALMAITEDAFALIDKFQHTKGCGNGDAR